MTPTDRALRADLVARLREFGDIDSGREWKYITAAAADTIEKLEAVVEEARRLEEAEHDYRLTHDSNPSGHINTGRAWDRMRRCGKILRAALADLASAEAEAEQDLDAAEED